MSSAAGLPSPTAATTAVSPSSFPRKCPATTRLPTAAGMCYPCISLCVPDASSHFCHSPSTFSSVWQSSSSQYPPAPAQGSAPYPHWQSYDAPPPSYTPSAVPPPASDSKAIPVRQMNLTQVLHLLSDLGLSSVAPAFEQNAVDGAFLATLSEADLVTELGESAFCMVLCSSS